MSMLFIMLMNRKPEPEISGQKIFPRWNDSFLSSVRLLLHVAFLCHYNLKLSSTIFIVYVYLPMKNCDLNIGRIRPPVIADFSMAVAIYFRWKRI